MRHRYSHSAVLALVLCAAPVCATGASAQAGATIKEDFETRLAPSPVTDGTRDNILGEGHATAVLAASIFHFGTYTIGEAKAHMAAAGIPMRLDPIRPFTGVA